jgi:hypothetical protein
MKTLMLAISIALLGLCGCSDNGVHLGFALTKGAETLEKKPDGSELVIRYEPLSGIHQVYYVNIPPSKSTVAPYRGDYLAVGGKRCGSTGYYTQIVYVGPSSNSYYTFSVTKTNAPTFLTLRKTGNRVELIDVH